MSKVLVSRSHVHVLANGKKRKRASFFFIPFGEAVSILSRHLSAADYPSRLHVAAALASGESLVAAGSTYQVLSD